ncbi:conserved hypothetical protein [Meinhardsimonia xiamenensis]|jgi:YfiH family protein|uniref:Purine nucleoside phosphorylase n=1 Tax=Meinhardsimonia xiamenensis TaxID=990712 RepID=A0A1G8ZAC1_9RHOB|nr:peptidoglycan editing factor PgeF [Meinhardsimonia xiamenensis]PRX37597.1 hypothetical protein LV81_01377 [Meinhardsimonia xiamenensis]SDK11355.1 conserved hypothetical protein [Meinhardsimonia xiamenensis]
MKLDIITHPLLRGTPHGFFGRRGGASSGIFAGLNCGGGSSDQSEAVAINRARAAQALGIGPEAVVGVHQVHSGDVVRVEGPLAGERPRADGMVTAAPGIALAILTADCAPVLLADREAGVIGAAHAGWKGLLAGILETVVDEMVAAGARRERINAVIGPTISQRAYEVGPEFLDAFAVEDPENLRFFANGEGDRYLFDLPGMGLARLRRAGINEAAWTGHCTYSDPERFYSYRRSCHRGEADYGRLISMIRL